MVDTYYIMKSQREFNDSLTHRSVIAQPPFPYKKLFQPNPNHVISTDLSK